MEEHVKFYVYNMPAIDLMYFCKTNGYEMHIEDYKIYIQKVNDDAKM